MDVGDEGIESSQSSKILGINKIKQEGASKFLTAYHQQSSINMNKSTIVSSSALNFIKNSLCHYLELMSVARHSSFDLFASLC
jgi:hypothetical protein